MNCQFVKERLSPYLDQALSREEMSLVAEHLRQCEACCEEFEVLRTTIDMVKSLEQFTPPESLRMNLRAKLQEEVSKQAAEKPQAKKSKFFSFPLKTLSIAAALLIFLLSLTSVPHYLSEMNAWQQGEGQNLATDYEEQRCDALTAAADPTENQERTNAGTQENEAAKANDSSLSGPGTQVESAGDSSTTGLLPQQDASQKFPPGKETDSGGQANGTALEQDRQPEPRLKALGIGPLAEDKVSVQDKAAQGFPPSTGVKIYLDEVLIGENGLIQEQEVMVPLIPLAQALGVEIVQGQSPGIVSVNGKEVKAFAKDGYLYLSLKMVEEVFGLTVKWNQEQKTVFFTRPLDKSEDIH